METDWKYLHSIGKNSGSINPQRDEKFEKANSFFMANSSSNATDQVDYYTFSEAESWFRKYRARAKKEINRFIPTFDEISPVKDLERLGEEIGLCYDFKYTDEQFRRVNNDIEDMADTIRRVKSLDKYKCLTNKDYKIASLYCTPLTEENIDCEGNFPSPKDIVSTWRELWRMLYNAYESEFSKIYMIQAFDDFKLAS